MEDLLTTGLPRRQELTQITEEERNIINDIRKLNFGKITVSVQNGVIVSKEVTIVTKNIRHKNNGFPQTDF